MNVWGFANCGITLNSTDTYFVGLLLHWCLWREEVILGFFHVQSPGSFQVSIQTLQF